MSSLIDKLNTLLSTGWKIHDITFHYHSMKSDKETTIRKVEGKGTEITLPLDNAKITVKLLHGSQQETLETEDDQEFKWYMMHFKPLPNLQTGEIESTYVDDFEKYIDYEVKFIDFICGNQPFLTIHQSTSLPEGIDRKRIIVAIDTWIDSQRELTRLPTRTPLMFYNVIVLFSCGGKFDCLIFDKGSTEIEQFTKDISRFASYDWAYVFSAVFLSPKLSAEFNRDALLIMALYDIKTRETAAGCVGTFRSVLNHAHRRFTPGQEISEVVELLSKRYIETSTLALVGPFKDSEFTPVPWVAYALLDDIPYDIAHPVLLREAIFFGDTGIASQRSSLDFKKKPQTAAITVDLPDNGRTSRYNLRFDRSPGEASFHIDFEVYPGDSSPRYKVIAHRPVLLRRIWDVSENLYLAFVAAGAFDVKFDSLVTSSLKDLNQLMRDEPLALYPLIYRGYIEPKEKWLSTSPDALALLRKFWDDEKYAPSSSEKPLVSMLEEHSLLESGGLTNSAIMILSRDAM